MMDKKINKKFSYFPRIFGFRKKAVSLMIAYTLLIAMILVLAVLIFAWLKYFVAPNEGEICSDAVFLAVNKYSYDGNYLNLTLKNKGLFSIDGFIIRGSSDNSFPEVSLSGVDGKHYVHLEPGEFYQYNFSTSALGGDLKKLYLQPFIEGDSGEDVFCNSLIKNIYLDGVVPCVCVWVNAGCDLGSCVGQMQQTRECAPPGCGTGEGDTQCVDDVSCSSVPPLPPAPCNVTIGGNNQIKTTLDGTVFSGQEYDNYVICVNDTGVVYIEASLGGANDAFEGWHGLTLRGINGRPVINLRNSAPGLIITSNYTTIENLELYSSNSHLVSVTSESLDALSNFRFINNIVHDAAKEGLHLENVYDVEIKDNEIYDVDGSGINITNVSDLEINNNEIYDLKGNGLNLMRGYGVEIKDNEIYGAVGRGLSAKNVSDLEITGNIFRDVGSYGVSVTYDALNPVYSNTKFINNTIYNTLGTGFYTIKADKVFVKDNLIYNVGDEGITLSASPNSEIVNNLVYGIGDDGIKVVSKSNYTIINNTVYNVTDTAFTIRGTVNASVKSNKVWWGIGVTSSTSKNGAFFLDEGNIGMDLYCNYINDSDSNEGNLPGGIGINYVAVNEINISHNYIDEEIFYNNNSISSQNFGPGINGSIIFSKTRPPKGDFVFDNNYCNNDESYCIQGDGTEYECCNNALIGDYTGWLGICGEAGSNLIAP